MPKHCLWFLTELYYDLARMSRKYSAWLPNCVTTFLLGKKTIEMVIMFLDGQKSNRINKGPYKYCLGTNWWNFNNL